MGGDTGNERRVSRASELRDTERGERGGGAVSIYEGKPGTAVERADDSEQCGHESVEQLDVHGNEHIDEFTGDKFECERGQRELLVSGAGDGGWVGRDGTKILLR
jgi:hypothetical protein